MQKINKDAFSDIKTYFFNNMSEYKKVKKILYWIDISICTLAYIIFFLIATIMPNLSLAIIMLFFSSIFFYRGLSFVHEFVHHEHELKNVKILWRIFFGIPGFYPTNFYRSHLEHHQHQFYGTIADPEYFTIEKKFSALLYSFLLALFIPVKLIGRSLVFPLTLISHKFSFYYEINMSHAYINPKYKGQVLTKAIKKNLFIEDLFSSLLLYVTLFLVIFNIIPVYLLEYYFFIFLCSSVLNHIRVLVTTHGYHDYNKKTYEQQVTDSFNYISQSLFSLIIAPVGLRYHALHHLFPSIPYHALKKAHYMLVTKFPEHSSYQSTIVENILLRLKSYLS